MIIRIIRRKNNRISKALIGFLMVMAFSLWLTGNTIVHAKNDGYPYTPAPGEYVVDKWGFFQGECTSFCAYKLNAANGVEFSNWYLSNDNSSDRWGNANHWDDFAKDHGVTVNKNPAVGAIAYWDNGLFGHVAWVSAVSGDEVAIEEYNYGSVTINGVKYSDHKYHTRTVSSSNPTGYIHIKDLGSEDIFGITKLTGGKKSFTVKWVKQTKKTTGYQIQYSTSSKFTSKASKSITITKNKTVSKKITGLKKNKKYYVRIRTYLKKNNKTTYSKWSSVKSVKTK